MAERFIDEIEDRDPVDTDGEAEAVDWWFAEESLAPEPKDQKDVPGDADRNEQSQPVKKGSALELYRLTRGHVEELGSSLSESSREQIMSFFGHLYSGDSGSCKELARMTAHGDNPLSRGPIAWDNREREDPQLVLEAVGRRVGLKIEFAFTPIVRGGNDQAWRSSVTVTPEGKTQGLVCESSLLNKVYSYQLAVEEGDRIRADQKLIALVRGQIRDQIDKVVESTMGADNKNSRTNDDNSIASMVKQLGSRSFRERETAQKGLPEIGIPAVPELFNALQDDDIEVRRRSQQALNAIARNVITDASALDTVKNVFGYGNDLKPFQRHLAIDLIGLADKYNGRGEELKRLSPLARSLSDRSTDFRAPLDITALQDNSVRLRLDCAGALANTDTPLATQLVREALKIDERKCVTEMPGLLTTAIDRLKLSKNETFKDAYEKAKQSIKKYDEVPGEIDLGADDIYSKMRKLIDDDKVGWDWKTREKMRKIFDP